MPIDADYVPTIRPPEQLREPDPNQPTPTTGGPDTPSAPITVPQPTPSRGLEVGQQQVRPPAPTVPHYQWTPPESVYEPEHPNFNAQFYMDRFRTLLQNTVEHTGVMPNPNVMHDFVRSGINTWGIRDVWQQMLANSPKPLGADALGQASDLPSVQKLPTQLKAELNDTQVISAPAAPWAGTRYDKDNNLLINNPTHAAPPHIDQEQLIKAALHNRDQADLSRILVGIRALRPDLVGKAMPLLAPGLGRQPDWEGAIAQMAAADPAIAGLVSHQLDITLPPGYSNSLESKWNTAIANYVQPKNVAFSNTNPGETDVSSAPAQVIHHLVLAPLEAQSVTGASNEDRIYNSLFPYKPGPRSPMPSPELQKEAAQARADAHALATMIDLKERVDKGGTLPLSFVSDYYDKYRAQQAPAWGTKSILPEWKTLNPAQVKMIEDSVTAQMKGVDLRQELGPLYPLTPEEIRNQTYPNWNNSGSKTALELLTNPLNFVGLGLQAAITTKLLALPLKVAGTAVAAPGFMLGSYIAKKAVSGSDVSPLIRLLAPKAVDRVTEIKAAVEAARLESLQRDTAEAAKLTQQINVANKKTAVFTEGISKITSASEPHPLMGETYTPAEQTHFDLVDTNIHQLRLQQQGITDPRLVAEATAKDEVLAQRGLPIGLSLGVGTAVGRGANLTALRDMSAKAQDTLRQVTEMHGWEQGTRESIQKLEAQLATAQKDYSRLLNSGRDFEGKQGALAQRLDKAEKLQVAVDEAKTDFAGRLTNLARDTGKLQAKLNRQVDQAVQFAKQNPLPRHPTLAKTEKALDDLRVEANRLRAVRNLKGQDPNVINQKTADLLDRISAAETEYYEAYNPLRHLQPLMRALQREEAKAIQSSTDLGYLAKQRQDLIAAQAISDPNSDIARTINTAINLWHEHDYNPGHFESILVSGLRTISTSRVIAEDMVIKLNKVFKQFPKEYSTRFFEDYAHPESLPADYPQPLLDVMKEIKAGFARAGGDLHDSGIIKDIEEIYYPKWSPLDRADFTTITGFRGELSKQAPPLQPRTGAETTAIPLDPATRVGNYFFVIGKARANRAMRTALMESPFADGAPMAIPFETVPQDANASGLKAVPGVGDHNYVRRDALGGFFDERVSRMLDVIGQPQILGDAKDAVNKLGQVNNWYKKWAMFWPTVHGWNQISAGMGVGAWGPLNPFRNITIGAFLKANPEALAYAGRDMFLQPRQIISDAVQKIMQANSSDPLIVKDLEHLLTPETASIIGKVNRGMHTFLWEDIVKNQQLGAWFVMRESLIRRGYTPEDAGKAAGTMAGQIAGIGDPKLLQKWERGLRDQLLFAYQWDKKHATIPAQALPLFGGKIAKRINPYLSDIQADAVASLSRRYMTRYTTTALASLFAAQLLLNGTPFWENEAGHKWDLEWTKIYNQMYEPDGKRHYIQFPALNFGRFYASKVQLFLGQGYDQAVSENLANITMPVPSWLANQYAQKGNYNLGEQVAAFVPLIDPWNRSLFTPLVRSAIGVSQHHAPGWEVPLSIVGMASGLHTSSGPQTPFVLTPKDIQNRTAVDMQIAIMFGISWMDASPEQRQQAQEAIAGESLFGGGTKTEINPEDMLNVAMGGIPGSTGPIPGVGEPLVRLRYEESQLIREALLKYGISEETLHAHEVRRETGAFLLSQILTDPSDRRKFDGENPLLVALLSARSSNSDQAKADFKNAQDRYWHGKDLIDASSMKEQAKLDAAYQSGEITGMQYRKYEGDNNRKKADLIKGLQKGFDPSVYDPAKYDPKAKPGEKGYQKPADIAYDQYVSINVDDPKYNMGLAPDFKQWSKDRADFLATVSPAERDYISHKLNSYRTETQKAYYAALGAYSQFLNDHKYLNDLETEAMSYSSTIRRIFLELHPEVKTYIAYKNEWWAAHPEVAKFYHSTDQEQWKGWSPDQQAVHLADWVIEYRIGHPEYLTTWQRSLITNRIDQAEAISGWSAGQIALYRAFIAQDEIDYQNRFRRSSSRPSRISVAKHSAPGPSIFDGQPVAAGGSQTASIFP